MRDQILKHKLTHIEVFNKKNTHNTLKLKPRLQHEASSQVMLARHVLLNQGEHAVKARFGERIQGIEIEM